MNRYHFRGTAVVGGVLLSTALHAAPVSAYIHPGLPVPTELRVLGPTETTPDRCPLQRVGTQFVRCDNLTGNGTTAPTSIPEVG